jgi:hypothetical protein
LLSLDDLELFGTPEDPDISLSELEGFDTLQPSKSCSDLMLNISLINSRVLAGRARVVVACQVESETD